MKNYLIVLFQNLKYSANDKMIKPFQNKEMAL